MAAPSFVCSDCGPVFSVSGNLSLKRQRVPPRMMAVDESYSLRPMRPEDANAVQALWSTRFGGDSSTQKNWMDAAVNPDHSAAGIVAVAAASGAVIGLSFLDVGGREYTRRYLGLDTLTLPLPLADRNGIFHLSCVRADWEGQGVGSAFYERRLAVLAERDISRAVGIAWHRPHTVDSRVLFEKYGFTSVATVERYYARTGPRANCPDCPGNCTCTASLYVRSLEPA